MYYMVYCSLCTETCDVKMHCELIEDWVVVHRTSNIYCQEATCKALM